MNINGMETKVDVIQSVIDNIDNNDLATAKDSLELLKEVEEGYNEALNPNGKYVLVENSEEPEDSKVDTMIQLENEAKQGK